MDGESPTAGGRRNQDRAARPAITSTPGRPRNPAASGFVERVIGTIRREFLDHVWFWNARDLERKLAAFQGYYNAARSHASCRANPFGCHGQTHGSPRRPQRCPLGVALRGPGSAPGGGLTTNSRPTGSDVRKPHRSTSLLARALPKARATLDAQPVGDDLSIALQRKRDQPRMTAADVEPVEVEQSAQGADGLRQAAVPTLLADFVERLFPKLSFVGIAVAERVVSELERRQWPPPVEHGRAESSAERDHKLNPLAPDGRESLNHRVVGHADPTTEGSPQGTREVVSLEFVSTQIRGRDDLAVTYDTRNPTETRSNPPSGSTSVAS